MIVSTWQFSFRWRDFKLHRCFSIDQGCLLFWYRSPLSHGKICQPVCLSPFIILCVFLSQTILICVSACFLPFFLFMSISLYQPILIYVCLHVWSIPIHVCLIHLSLFGTLYVSLSALVYFSPCVSSQLFQPTPIEI